MTASSHIENNTEDRQILENLSKIAAGNAEILLIGPSDLDKERYARHIHEWGSNSKCTESNELCKILKEKEFSCHFL